MQRHKRIEKAFELAKEQYNDVGVDAAKALKLLRTIANFAPLLARR